MTVYLVGAGPGDPGLLTRRGAELLARADVVVYDRLSHPSLLDLAPTGAERVAAGKAPGRAELTQDEINRVLVERGRTGATVVRLKGGDPFVFGRGGEEALALRAAGVPFDVVPGVTSAVAAPALAGIPVTHRGVASGVLVVSGHDEDAFSATTAQVAPNLVTLVVLMGLTRSAALAARLIASGWSPETPAAVVVDASTARQHVWRGRLDELAVTELPLDTSGPGTIVVGEVASLDLQQGARGERLASGGGAPRAVGKEASHVSS